MKNLILKKDFETLAEFSGICKAIKEKFKDDNFSVKISTEKELIVILKLPTWKASVSNEIATSILNQ